MYKPYHAYQLYQHLSKLIKPSLIALLASLSLSAFAQQSIPRAEQAPNLADFRDAKNTPNKAGLEVNNFTVTAPRDGAKPTYATKAYLSYDNQYLYAVFVATANPDYLIARHARRETTDGEDFVMLQVDTFNDKQRAFVFYVTPLGVQAESRFIEGKEEDFDFDTQWQSEGEVTPTGYIVKIAIPFKSLRFANSDQQTWGVSLGRYSTEANEFATWPHISKNKPSVVDQFATMVIAEKIPSTNQLQWLPYFFSGSSKILNPQLYTDKAKQAFVENRKTQVGFDAKYVWNNAFTFDLTVKPDFSDVESDEPQVTVDKRFEVLIAERRPFFIENGAFFRTPIPLFFSRRVVQPNQGLRMSGRQGDMAVGALLIDDKNDSQANAHIAIGRGQFDIGGKGNLGFITINNRTENMKNAVNGIDMHFAFGENWLINSQYAYSDTQALSNNDTTRLRAANHGQLFYTDLTYGSGPWKYIGKLSRIDQDFDVSLGYIPRRGIQQSEQSIAYTSYGSDDAILQSQNLKSSWSNTQDQQQNFLDRRLELLYTAKAKAANTIMLQVVRQEERLGTLDASTQGWLATWISKTIPQVTSTIAIGKKQAPNYAYTTLNQVQGHANNLQAKVMWTPGRHWSFEENFFLTELNHQSGNVYRDKLSRTNINYQFNNYLGVSAIIDYHDFTSNPQLTSLKTNKALNSSLQLRYVLAPGTSFFINYVDRREGLQLVSNGNDFFSLKPSRDLDLRTGRNISMKLSYLF